MQSNSANQPNEIDLIIAAQRDPQRFSSLYERWYKPVFLFVFRRINDKEITADITSQVFLKALLQIKKFQFTGAPFSCWLFRIAINEVNMFYRKSGKQITISLNENDLRGIIEEPEENETEEKLVLLVDAMNELPEDQMKLLELRFFDKNSFSDMAHILGESEAGTKMKVYRILEKLKKIITLKRTQ